VNKCEAHKYKIPFWLLGIKVAHTISRVMNITEKSTVGW